MLLLLQTFQVLMSYTIYATDSFKKVFASLDGSERAWIAKMKAQLEENPAGKILRFEWFREKKFGTKRLFFLVDDEAEKILFVSFASKKEQQDVIDFVVENKEELLEHLRSL